MGLPLLIPFSGQPQINKREIPVATTTSNGAMSSEDKVALNSAATASNFYTFLIQAGNGAGARTCTGAVIGDKVLMAAYVGAGGAPSDAIQFESTITVTNQIQQTNGNGAGAGFSVLLLRSS